eukprot:scaffold19455_cov18-Tisochrysis_lutea.AAC.3
MLQKGTICTLSTSQGVMLRHRPGCAAEALRGTKSGLPLLGPLLKASESNTVAPLIQALCLTCECVGCDFEWVNVQGTLNEGFARWAIPHKR